jgi:myo-inositol-1(or 4)-monophosphatase
MNYKLELNLLKEITKRIYEETLNLNMETNFKSTQDLVTSNDLYIERRLIEEIKKVFPNDHFHTEEGHNKAALQNRTWVIDPIDGTSNYAANLELFVIQIALYEDNETVLAYMYAPKLNSTYYAIKGYGAYLNEERYFANHKKDLTFMVLLVGLTQKRKNKEYYHRLIDLSIKQMYKIRMLGTIGLELAKMSEGAFDICYTNITNLWDLLPGVLLAKESGCILVNERGLPYKIGDENLFIARNEKSLAIIKNEIL